MRDPTLRITIDSATISPSKAIAAAARSRALVVVTGRAFGDLSDELGGYEGAWRHLQRVASNTGRPIGVNLPTDDGSRTVFLAPRGWSDERLRGWVAGRREELEAEYGPATVRPL